MANTIEGLRYVNHHISRSSRRLGLVEAYGSCRHQRVYRRSDGMIWDEAVLEARVGQEFSDGRKEETLKNLNARR
jgi:hypothetical protein